MLERENHRKLDILLIDDDEGDILLTRKVLEKVDGYSSINIAHDGVEAMRYLRREGEYRDSVRPDLVLTDLNMPRMNGQETLVAIKADPELSSIPVIVLTTSDSDDDVRESYRLQANGFICKPADLKEFSRLVNSMTDYWISVSRLPRKQGRP